MDTEAANLIDRTALAFVQSWHSHPSVKEILEYDGVNLGVADEYVLFQLLLATLVAQAQNAAP